MQSDKSEEHLPLLLTVHLGGRVCCGTSFSSVVLDTCESCLPYVVAVLLLSGPDPHGGRWWGCLFVYFRLIVHSFNSFFFWWSFGHFYCSLCKLIKISKMFQNHMSLRPCHVFAAFRPLSCSLGRA